MSTILLTNHNENIYNIIKREDGKPPPKISAKSPFKVKCPEPEKKGNKYCHKTFGFAEVPLNKPSEYLKKNSRLMPACPKTEEPRCLLSQRLPKIPPWRPVQAKKKQEHDKARLSCTSLNNHTDDNSQCYPSKSEETEKEMEEKQDVQQPEHSVKDKRINGHNYCYQNVVQAKKLVPRQPRRSCVDTRKGDAYTLQYSGLEPHYVQKKTFGKIPSYLHRHKLQAEASIKEMQVEINQFKPQGHYITEQERKSLLQGLKHNWEELHKAYQRLPILTDTLPKKRHKIKLEEELKQLESDIRTLERHLHIYVTDADCSEFSYDPHSD